MILKLLVDVVLASSSFCQRLTAAAVVLAVVGQLDCCRIQHLLEALGFFLTRVFHFRPSTATTTRFSGYTVAIAIAIAVAVDVAVAVIKAIISRRSAISDFS